MLRHEVEHATEVGKPAAVMKQPTDTKKEADNSKNKEVNKSVV